MVQECRAKPPENLDRPSEKLGRTRTAAHAVVRGPRVERARPRMFGGPGAAADQVAEYSGIFVVPFRNARDNASGNHRRQDWLSGMHECGRLKRTDDEKINGARIQTWTRESSARLLPWLGDGGFQTRSNLDPGASTPDRAPKQSQQVSKCFCRQQACCEEITNIPGFFKRRRKLSHRTQSGICEFSHEAGAIEHTPESLSDRHGQEWAVATWLQRGEVRAPPRVRPAVVLLQYAPPARRLRRGRTDCLRHSGQAGRPVSRRTAADRRHRVPIVSSEGKFSDPQESSDRGS